MQPPLITPPPDPPRGRGRAIPGPRRQSAQGIRLQPPPADNPAAVNPNILATLATPAGVLSLARGVNQRKESGCNPRG